MIILGERYQYCLKLIAPYQSEHDHGFELRAMSKRWGSCTPKGKIFLNPLLVSATKDCIDYVIVHELCHLRFPNHSSSFYRLLSRIMPDWIDRKNRLNSRVELRS
jgi:predicted metal-dependent hydrolase